ncbi:uncharacterized protein LOC129347768 [Amphiprion ocellaris]|uniref:uncharacterized protein LOC129347768 n=1 Tax=Amphiprion ocellaris TaxID=80972 RepID=UPI00241125CE|nr:uncharacterized protein LOC129347768 [Amphiprion ocellaris]
MKSCLNVRFFCFTVYCQDVTQSPEISWSFASKSAEMDCSHNKGITHTQMYWYRQRPGETMTLIVYQLMVGSRTMVESLKLNIQPAKKKIKSGALTVRDLQPEDSRVYFCAVSKHCDVRSVSLGLEVRQSSSEIITKPGDKVEVFCSHNKTDYRTMLWYQRSPGDTAMKLIGFLLGFYMHSQNLHHYHYTLPFNSHLHLHEKKNKMILFLICCQLAGLSLGVQVNQSPSAVLKKEGEEVKLFCTHEQTDYKVMIWYQKSPGDEALKFIGYGYGQFHDDGVEQPFRKDFKLAGDLSGQNTMNGSLSITNVTAQQHNATYFCAVREAQYSKHPSALNKNLLLARLSYLASESLLDWSHATDNKL